MANLTPLVHMIFSTFFLASYFTILCSATHNYWQETFPGSGLTYTVPTGPYASYVQTANGPLPVYYQPQSSWLMSAQPFVNDPVGTMTPVYVPLDTIIRTNQQSGQQIYSAPSDQDSDEDETALMIDQENDRSPDLPVPCTGRYVTTRAIAACVLTMLLLSVMIGLLTYFLSKPSHHGY